MKPSDFAYDSPVTLKVGEAQEAYIEGYDQDGMPFEGPLPAATFTVDNPKIDSLAGATVTALAVGEATVTATVKGPNGELLDGQKVTNVSAEQVLTSIKVRFRPAAGAPVASPSGETAKVQKSWP